MRQSCKQSKEQEVKEEPVKEKLTDEELEEVSGGKGLEFSPEQQDEFEVVAVPMSDG